MNTFPEDQRIADLEVQIAQLEAKAEKWAKRVADAKSTIAKIDSEFMDMLLADDRDGLLRLFDSRRYSATIVANDVTISRYFQTERIRLDSEMTKRCSEHSALRNDFEWAHREEHPKGTVVRPRAAHALQDI